MNNKVVVAASKDGAVVCVSKKNAQYGYIRLKQERVIFAEDGWASKRILSALITGELELLQELNYHEGQEMPGKIRVIERLKPFNLKNPEKDYKLAGADGAICKVDGQIIFRNCVYTQDSNAEDIYIKHDNYEEIKARSAELKAQEEKADLS